MSTGGTKMTIGGLAKKAVSTGMAAAFAAMLALAVAPSGAAAAACPLAILTCGCTINSSGSYTLSGTSPMHSTGTCVDIAASNVTLAGGLALLMGPGPTTATFGVRIEPTANKVSLDSITAEDFGQGIRIDGPNATSFGALTFHNNRGTVVNGANAF